MKVAIFFFVLILMIKNYFRSIITELNDSYYFFKTGKFRRLLKSRIHIHVPVHPVTGSWLWSFAERLEEGSFVSGVPSLQWPSCGFQDQTHGLELLKSLLHTITTQWLITSKIFSFHFDVKLKYVEKLNSS